MPGTVLTDLRTAWDATSVPARGLQLLVLLGAFVLWPSKVAGGVAAAVAVVLLVLAWVGWLVADPLARRRSTSLTGTRAVVVVVLLGVVSAAGGFVAGRTEAGWVFACCVIAGIAAGRDVRVPGAVAVLLAGTAGVELGLLTGDGGSLAAVLGYPAGLLSAALAGIVRAGRRDREEQTLELLRASERARTEQARGAALAERARIAREVHDVLAHSLGGLAIQLEVADALLDSGELSDRTRTAALQRVRTAHELATAGLEETRRAVHALRVDSPPLPDSLATLAAGARANGGQVTVQVEGRPRPLGAGEVALLRTAQEALVNAAKHAAGAQVAVDLRYGEEDTTLVVTDSGTTHPDGPRPRTVDGGFGLAGLRERLELVGGSLAAGPYGGGWRVTARLPM